MYVIGLDIRPETVQEYCLCNRIYMFCGTGKLDYCKGCNPGAEVIKLFSCSAQLRLKFILLINVKMPTVVQLLAF